MLVNLNTPKYAFKMCQGRRDASSHTTHVVLQLWDVGLYYIPIETKLWEKMCPIIDSEMPISCWGWGWGSTGYTQSMFNNIKNEDHYSCATYEKKNCDKKEENAILISVLWGPSVILSPSTYHTMFFLSRWRPTGMRLWEKMCIQQSWFCIKPFGYHRGPLFAKKADVDGTYITSKSD